MITPDELAALIRVALPDAQVQALDRTGTLDHYNVRVVSKHFAAMPLLDQHRAVYAALGEPLRDGRLHAMELKTEVPTN
jgi:stress-induced morphogen